ncbi:hypothetical protein BH11MYX1_BH11MYX1_54430 [soil metagenome]
MTIRETAYADFAAITAMTNEVIATTAIHFGYEPLGEDELVTLWRAQRAQFPWLTMVEQDDVLGYAKAGAWRPRPAYQWTCETTIYMAERLRGRGLGTQLYGALLEACRERGFHSAIGCITLPNRARSRCTTGSGSSASACSSTPARSSARGTTSGSGRSCLQLLRHDQARHPPHTGAFVEA